MLINNAGVFNSPINQTSEGFQHELVVNYFGPVFLTNLLLKREIGLKKVVNVTSSLAKYGSFFFDDLKGLQMEKKVRYRNSKLALTAFTNKIIEEYKDKDVEFMAVHPGLVVTKLGRNILPNWFSWVEIIILPLLLLLAKLPIEGAQSILYCIAEDCSSGYYGDSRRKEWPQFCDNKEAINKLYKETISLLSNF
ncbi:unnamed protein product [Dimorphilus gyrociliatus]|uniref:Uncharacterized protein n=1 Tax=Dimorphilus gyrociliatus TaxID=2664684 RepID=A0A7I8VD14_9ANNE|nr:unnamed protein product [Dimorphilus gyrociliatus]